MATRNKRLLIYSSLLLFIMACRAYRCTDDYALKDDDVMSPSVVCTEFIQDGNPLAGLECTMNCPGIGAYQFDVFGNVSFSNMTKAEAQAMYCPQPEADLVVSTEEPVVTEEPIVTEEPTEPPAEIMPSILDGKVSYCAEAQAQKYLNLPFNSGADPALVQSKLASKELTVQVGNVNGNCKVDEVHKLLVCAFPASTFPNFSSTAPNSIINVADQGTVIDVILFNNTCEAEQNSSSGGGSEEPVCDPTEPGTPCFCALNPFDESCTGD